MDQGWAVVLGAMIALAGSSIIPWLREVTGARGRAAQEKDRRLRDATVELLAANAAQAAALTFDNDQDLHLAFEARSRATARVLLEVSRSDRRAVADTINAGAPGRSHTGEKVRAFQYAFTAWAAGDLPSSELEATYRAEVERLKSRASR